MSAKSYVQTCNEMHSGALNLLSSHTVWCPSSGLCILCVRKECLNLWRATQRILYAGGQQSVWYLPEVLCQKAINRFMGHPPSPNPQQSHQPTPHLQPSTHGRTSPLACPVKRRWAVSHDAVFRWEEPALWESMLIRCRRWSFYFVFRISRACSAYSGEIIQCNILQELFGL